MWIEGCRLKVFMGKRRHYFDCRILGRTDGGNDRPLSYIDLIRWPVLSSSVIGRHVQRMKQKDLRFETQSSHTERTHAKKHDHYMLKQCIRTNASQSQCTTAHKVALGYRHLKRFQLPAQCVRHQYQRLEVSKKGLRTSVGKPQ